MRVSRALAAIFASTFLVVPLGAAQALTLTFGGGHPTFPPFPGYGTTVAKNNVLDGPHAGNSVTDTTINTNDGKTFVATTTAGGPAKVMVGVDAAHGYNVDWYFIGAESGYDVTLNVPHPLPGPPPVSPVVSFTEGNQNNQCTFASCGSLASLAAGQIGPQFLGTTTHSNTETVLNFSMTAKQNGVEKGTLQNGDSNPKPGQPPVNGNMNASLVFSYLKLLNDTGGTYPTALGEENDDFTAATESSKTWKLRNTPLADSGGGLWFLFAFNDTGGPDDNHDDFVGVARVSEFALPPPPVDAEVPLPAGFLLMGTVLAGAGGIAGWRRRRKAVA